jgi:methanethiol S-methyltransferase
MKKLFAVLYGVVSYALFLAVILYMIAFVANRVPWPISGPQRIPGAAAAVMDVGLITLFGLQHSIMARMGCKRWLTTFVPAYLERSTYVLISSVLVGAVLLAWQPIGGVIWDVPDPFATILLTVSGLGWTLVFTSMFLTDHFGMFGLRQAFTYAVGRTPADEACREQGMYRVVRHPMMLGFLVAFWSAPLMTVGHLLFAGLMTIYILVGIYFKERDLTAAHGRAYAGYRERVPMLLPWLPSARAGEATPTDEAAAG